MLAELSHINNVKLFKYKELKNATDDFSEAHKIGEGGFGPVYKVDTVVLLIFIKLWSLHLQSNHLRKNCG